MCKSLLVSQNAVPVSLEAGGDVPSRPNPSATLLVLRAMRENKIVICPFTVHVVSLNENNNDIFQRLNQYCRVNMKFYAACAWD